jgi:hypothetical protein
VFFFTLYRLGLRLGEGLRLQVGDIDAQRGRVHIHDSKGNKDQLVPLSMATLAGLSLPGCHPRKWVVDCKHVGSGEKALVYLGRYLYRGVLQEKDILAYDHGQVTFRYRNSKTRRTETRTLSGATFLWLLLQHVQPKGFRRARNFGFLHPNSKRLIQLLRLLFKIDPGRVLASVKQRPPLLCPCCGAPMTIIRTRLLPLPTQAPPGAPEEALAM